MVRGPTERHIRFFQLQCLLFGEYGETAEIAWTLKPDTAVLTETRTRLPPGSNYTVQRLAGYTAVHFGWGRGCYTNRSTCVCILLGKRFQTSYDQGSQFPLGLTGWTRRCHSAERRYDGFGHLGASTWSSSNEVNVRDKTSAGRCKSCPQR